MSGNKQFFPVTLAIIAVTSAVTLLQFVYPEVLTMLRRNPSALAEGEWWRMVTPLLVHADGWWQYVLNMFFLAIIGVAAERIFSRFRFIILYLMGGLVGEIVAYAAWDPYGAGASVGFCGLLGGLCAVMLSRKRNHQSVIRRVEFVCHR